MCGGTDSQDHWLQHCLHPNVKTIRQVTKNNIEALATQLASKEDVSKVNHELHSRMVREIANMLDTEDGPSRIWTSNWNTNMINKLGESLKLRTVNKKVQVSLRNTLLEIGSIFAEGAREILAVRQTMQTMQVDADRVPKTITKTGKQLVLNEWLTHGRLHIPATKIVRKSDEIHATGTPHLVNDITDDQLNQLNQLTSDDWTAEHIHSYIENIPITTRSLQRVLSDGYIDDEVVNGYLSLLNRQQHHTNSHCMHTSFFDFLYNPSGAIRYLEANCLHYNNAKRYTDNIDIFTLHNWTVPVFLGSRTSGHWTLLNANMMTKEVRYYDSLGCGGRQYAEALCEFIREEWRSKKQGEAPTWTSLGSDASVPHQGATNDCAIYSLLFAHAIHQNLPVSTSHFSIDGRIGRRHVAHCILTGHLSGNDHNRSDTGILSDGQSDTKLLHQNDNIELTDRNRQPLRSSTATNIDTTCPIISKEVHSTHTDTTHNAKQQVDLLPDRVGDYSNEPNWDKVELKEWEEAGLGLFTKTRMTRNTLIGLLTGATGSTLDKQDTREVLDYIMYSGGQYIDAWDAQTGKVTCLVGFVNDPLDRRKANAKWVRRQADDGKWTTWLRCTRDLEPGEQILVNYGARFWCHARHLTSLMVKAVHAYTVDIVNSSSTNNGNWRGLPTEKYAEIAAQVFQNQTTLRISAIKPAHIKHTIAKGTLHEYFKRKRMNITSVSTIVNTLPLSKRVLSKQAYTRKEKSIEALCNFILPRTLIGEWWRVSSCRREIF